MYNGKEKQMNITDSPMIYFVVHPSGDRKVITVVDLARSCDYEKGDWCCIDNNEFDNHIAAISYAREIARVNSLSYKPFDSRYDSSLSEPLWSV